MATFEQKVADFEIFILATLQPMDREHNSSYCGKSTSDVTFTHQQQHCVALKNAIPVAEKRPLPPLISR